MNISCWLWPLISGLFCGILGYLIGRMLLKHWQGKYYDLNKELDECKKKNLKAKDSESNLPSKQELRKEITLLEAKLKALNDSNAKLKTDLNDCISSKHYNVDSSDSKINPSLGLIPFSAEVAKTAFGKKVKQDDLKIVEGIGPKIEKLFHDFNIKTWKDLGETSVEKCKEVLNSGGDRYRIHVPNTWPKQAKMAYEGKWEELKTWQDNLKGGKA